MLRSAQVVGCVALRRRARFAARHPAGPQARPTIRSHRRCWPEAANTTTASMLTSRFVAWYPGLLSRACPRCDYEALQRPPARSFPYAPTSQPPPMPHAQRRAFLLNHRREVTPAHRAAATIRQRGTKERTDGLDFLPPSQPTPQNR